MSYPINQVFLGSNPMMGNLDDLDAQINKMQAYRNKLRQMQNPQQPQKLIWDEIDAEIIPMTEEQKSRLLQDPEYAEIYSEIQGMVQNEILNLVKGRIESTEKGKDLLTKQLRIVKKLKSKIISDTNREMELFNKFREYSKQHPDVTYEDFIKANI